MNAAFERVKAELAALPQDELQPITLDISAAVATVLGVLPEVTALRERVVKELPSFNVARFDKLEDYALALNFAHVKFLSASQPPDDLAPVAQQSTKTRERLLAEANSLVLDGVLGEAQLAQLKGANGYKNIATDVSVLSNVLREVWPQIQGKTRLTEQDLDEGLRLSARLLRIVGVREQGPAQVAEASSQRQRAYTLLMVAYDDARRAVAFLRADEGDADDIAPSLHPGRPRAKRSDTARPGALGSTAPAPSTGGTASSIGATSESDAASSSGSASSGDAPLAAAHAASVSSAALPASSRGPFVQ
jgi:hypothetical protein